MNVTAIQPSGTQQKLAQQLVKEMQAHNGLAPVALERFWANQDLSVKDPFGKTIPQVPLGIWMTDECVFAELGVEEDHWRLEHDHEWAWQLKKAYNDKAEKIVGRRLMNETRYDPQRQYPPVKTLHDVFEAVNTWHAGSWWLEKSAHSEDELKALLGRVEACDIRRFILPENWAEEKTRLLKLGLKPPLYRQQRGPVTFATSIYGSEELIFLLMDNPALAIRFRDAILKTILEIARIMDEEAGYTPATAPHGFNFNDDNCCLLNPEMYELFGYPILRAVFERYAPNPGDRRRQHSDSAMGHLLPLLAKLKMTALNLGPTLTVSEIRRHCPNTVIEGQLAPFTFSRNEEEHIVLEFLRDFEMAREERGLLFAASGVVNNGSRLTGLRLIMAAIQRFGRYVNA